MTGASASKPRGVNGEVEEHGNSAIIAVICATRGLYWPLRMRIRQWGRLPGRRGPTLLIANHQHEDESEIICERAFVGGPWKRPLYTASSRRMFEPGFFALRMPALRFARRWNASRVFLSFGLLPLENELSSRPLGSLAHAVRTAHGDLALADVFREPALAQLETGAVRCSDLLAPRFFSAAQRHVKLAWLKEPYRSEAFATTRALVEEDIARIRAIVQRGRTFYVTPEGEYSTTGKMRPLRGIVTHLVPIAEPWLAAIAFDPFRGRRLSMLYRVLPPADRSDLAASLAAARPVTTSALLAAHLSALAPGASFTRENALRAVCAARDALPAGVFVDPELVRHAERCVDDALARLTRRGALRVEDAGRYHLGTTRADPRFPFVTDMIAYQAAFLEETVAAARRLVVR